VRLSAPRIPPLSDTELSPEQAQIVAPMAGGAALTPRRVLNVFRTLVRAPALAEAFLVWGRYILDKARSLDPRTRELLILRTGFNCRSGYEWTQHVPIGRRAGLTESDLEAIKAGPDHPRWGLLDALLLKAADELHADQFVTEPTWSALSDHLDEKTLMDVVMTVGQYTQVAMFLNTMGVPLDEGQTLDEDLDFR
jgi:alkylhydroperoxidase family enzyme